MDSFWQSLLKRQKRKREESEEEVENYLKTRKRKRKRRLEIDPVIFCVVSAAAIVGAKPKRKKREKNCARDKSWWTNGYLNWNEQQFKKRLRVTRETFEFILTNIGQHIQKQPTNLNRDPIQPDSGKYV